MKLHPPSLPSLILFVAHIYHPVQKKKKIDPSGSNTPNLKLGIQKLLEENIGRTLCTVIGTQNISCGRLSVMPPSYMPMSFYFINVKCFH